MWNQPVYSRWEWAEPDLAQWPQGQFMRPRVDLFHQKFVASLTRWVHEADPKVQQIVAPKTLSYL